ncbi:META domain-containing protein [Marinigracilibium pacificum]|uniref:META domain-containing protein n=1 Tax=Marinigracilibium pacificum TaxID=2729599 RepID=A0A848J1J2_9BACT|nr:META domain-containing protein [Marinigracilibium pacificum]NMM49218.1 META domain-containing protein [Marinigracilibium pacificum]
MSKINILLLLIIMLSCKSVDKSGNFTESQFFGTWIGAVATDEAEPFRYELTLESEKNFHEVIILEDKKNNEIISDGKWSINNGKIELTKEGENTKTFKIEENSLKLIWDSGNDVEKENIILTRLSNKIRKPNYYIDKAIKGIDFTGSGHSPDWTLDIDFEKNITISYPDAGINYSTPVTKNSGDESGNTLIFVSETPKGQLTLTLNKTECFDDQLKESFEYSVTVTLKLISMDQPLTLEGCGNFLADYKLHDIWVLRSVNKKSLDPGIVFKQSPYLEFNLTNKVLFGFTGCNRVKGELSFNHHSLSIHKLAGTKMTCQAEALETQFTEILTSGLLRYSFNNNELILENSRGSLEFKKAD